MFECGYLREVGVGGSLLGMGLTGYGTWKALAYLSRARDCKDPTLRWMRSLFHVLIVLASVMDLPLYLGFAVSCKYVSQTYAFHKLQAPALFAALSVTVSIWSGVLYELGDEYRLPVLLRHVSLFVINIVFTVTALATFVELVASSNVDKFVNSLLYSVMYWVQIACQILVTSFMLQLGLKLSMRIKGASVDNDHSSPSPFNKALQRLNLVMSICLACALMQCTLLILNYTLSDPTDTKSFFMNPVWYFALEYWVPQAGWCLGLLSLSRNPPSQQTNTGNDIGRFTASSPRAIFAIVQSPVQPIPGQLMYSLPQHGTETGPLGSDLRYSTWYTTDKRYGEVDDDGDVDSQLSQAIAKEAAVQRRRGSSSEPLRKPLLFP